MSGPVRPRNYAAPDDKRVPLVSGSSSEHSAECRICLESDGADDLIAPCFCSGTSEFVHRSCLDRWRAVKQNARAFTHCTTCGFEFRLKLERAEDKGSGFLGRKSKFRLLMARDVFIGFAAIQAIVIITALILYSVDSSRSLPKEYGQWISHEKCSAVDYDPGGRCSEGYNRLYYGMGLFVMFCVLGGIIVVNTCISAIRTQDQNRCRCCDDCCGDPETLYLFWLFDPAYGGCESCTQVCEGMLNCSADSECCVGIFIVLVFFIFLLVIVGALAAFFLGVFALQRAVQRHQSVLHKGMLAKEYIVLDRSEWLEDMQSSAGLLPASVDRQEINRSVPSTLAALETSLSWSAAKHGGVSVSLSQDLWHTA
jgi:hypothetical protein